MDANVIKELSSDGATESVAAGEAVAVGRLEAWAGTFSYNAVRQVRYILAMVACGLLFHWVGVHVLASPWKLGASNAAWGPAGSLEAELIMLVALAVAIFMGMFITWPDTPHSGLLTAAVGLAVLGVRWGPINYLLLQHQTDLSRVYEVMLWQCAYWVIFVLAGEAIARGLYRIIFRNSLWRHLAGFDGLPMPEMTVRGLVMPFTASAIQLDAVPQRSLGRRLAENIGGFGLTGVVAVLVLFILMRSQLVGQVLFANLLAFGAGSLVAGVVFADLSTWAVWPAIPVTVAVLYLFGMHVVPAYPGQAGLRLAGALPIDYVSAGLVGAVLGYYTALRMHLRRQWEKSANFDDTGAGS